MLDFVQQLMKTCAYINIYKASDIQATLAKSLWNDTYKKLHFLYLLTDFV